MHLVLLLVYVHIKNCVCGLATELIESCIATTQTISFCKSTLVVLLLLLILQTAVVAHEREQF